MIINRLYETQNFMSLYLLPGRARTYQHPCMYSTDSRSHILIQNTIKHSVKLNCISVSKLRVSAYILKAKKYVHQKTGKKVNMEHHHVLCGIQQFYSVFVNLWDPT